MVREVRADACYFCKHCEIRYYPQEEPQYQKTGYCKEHGIEIKLPEYGRCRDFKKGKPSEVTVK